MPSRVRIRLTMDGRRVHDTKAVHSLEQMYRRSVEKGFSSKIGVLPEVKWRKAVILFQNIKQYVHHYDPGMRLLVVRERRGERSKTPAAPTLKMHKVKARQNIYNPPPQRAAIPRNAPAGRPNDWMFNPIAVAEAAPIRFNVEYAAVQNLNWNLNNDPNR